MEVSGSWKLQAQSAGHVATHKGKTLRPNVLAYCVGSQSEVVRKAAGVIPLCCPPVNIETFDKRWLYRPYKPFVLLYFSLHGVPDQPYWYGDNWETALGADAFEGLDLSSTVVFVANCYLEGSPMEKALLDCNPKALIGGAGQNWTRNKRPVGANLLGWYVRRLVCGGLEPGQALHLAKLGLRGKNSQLKRKVRKAKTDQDDIAANIDAMQFKIVEGISNV